MGREEASPSGSCATEDGERGLRSAHLPSYGRKQQSPATGQDGQRHPEPSHDALKGHTPGHPWPRDSLMTGDSEQAVFKATPESPRTERPGDCLFSIVNYRTWFSGMPSWLWQGGTLLLLSRAQQGLHR
jgi:hypothetical protein